MLQLHWHYSHLATRVDSLLSSAFSTRVPHNDVFVATFFGDSGDAAATMQPTLHHGGQRDNGAPTECRFAPDGVAYTFKEFATYYGEGAQLKWDTSAVVPVHPDCDETSGGEHPAQSSQPKDYSTSDPTGDSPEATLAPAELSGRELALAPAVQVLLIAAEIEDLRKAEAQRSQHDVGLHKLARSALQEISNEGPNRDVDPNLEEWFPWREYVACHEFAYAIVGPGIFRAVAQFIVHGPGDPNRRRQPRLDFMFYRTDNTVCRLHPGKNKNQDAQLRVCCSLSAKVSTSTRNDLNSVPVIPYTLKDAERVPQTDRMGKRAAYTALQETNHGPLGHDLFAKFEWWLFICNLGNNTVETIGCGIVEATLDDTWHDGVQLSLTRNDNTTAKLQIIQKNRGRYTTHLR